MIFLKHVPHTRNGACFQPSTLNGAPNMDHHPQVVRLICCALPSLTFEHWFQAARNGESCAKMWFNMVWFQLISTRLECGNLSISVFFASVDTYPPPQLSPAGIPEEQHWTPLNTTEWTTRYIYMQIALPYSTWPVVTKHCLWLLTSFVPPPESSESTWNSGGPGAGFVTVLYNGLAQHELMSRLEMTKPL
jgi:hypothetical protein